MSYAVEFRRRAAANLSRLDRRIERRIRDRINDMAESAEDWRHVALTGQYSGQFRLRVGSYRAVYELDHANRCVIVIRVQHRSGVPIAGVVWVCVVQEPGGGIVLIRRRHGEPGQRVGAQERANFPEKALDIGGVVRGCGLARGGFRGVRYIRVVLDKGVPRLNDALGASQVFQARKRVFTDCAGHLMLLHLIKEAVDGPGRTV